jgi:hypothetical protein
MWSSNTTITTTWMWSSNVTITWSNTPSNLPYTRTPSHIILQENKCYLLWIDKERAKDKVYTWVSVWWKTTTFKRYAKRWNNAKGIRSRKRKKNSASPQGLRRKLHGANSKLSGWQLILEVPFTLAETLLSHIPNIQMRAVV